MLTKLNIGVRGKTTLGLGFLIFTSLFIASEYSYWKSRVYAEQNIISLRQISLERLGRQITTILTSERESLLALRDVPPVTAIIRSRNAGGIDPVRGGSLEQWKKRLEDTFLSFTRNSKSYAQLKYIDATGNELVRVDSLTGQAAVVDDLQNQEDNLYVAATLKLPAGKVYHSNVSLNRANGVIQRPLTPILRIATPVYLQENDEVQGLIVIHIYINDLFKNIFTEPSGVKRFVSDEQGQYLKHFDTNKLFGETLGTGYNLSQDTPELLALSKLQDSVIRFDVERVEVNGFQKIFFSPNEKSRFWLLSINIPQEIAFAPIINERNSSLLAGIIMGLFTLMVSLWMTTRNIVTPVVRLAEIAKKMQQGNTVIRADPSLVKDEFRLLYSTFNDLAANQQLIKADLEADILLKTQRHVLIIDSLIDSLITLDKMGTIESFNPASERIFGYLESQVIGQNINLLIPGSFHNENDNYLLEHLSTYQKQKVGIGREMTGRRKDGSKFVMELAVSELNVGGELHFTGIVRDISDRQIAEQNVLDEKARLLAVINNVIDGIITINEKGIIETFNPAAARIFGYHSDEVIAQNVKLLIPESEHGGYDNYLLNHVNIDAQGLKGVGHEIIGLRKDGSTFPMEMALSTLLIGDQNHFAGIVRDITERKRIELMQKEFISTVSHELRTPLTSIRGSLGLILAGVVGELPPKVHALLDIANNNSERLVTLINDILDSEKITAGKMDFRYTVTNLIPVIQKSLDSNKGYGDLLNVKFVFDMSSNEKVIVRIDEKRIDQVMSNLLSNAAKNSPSHSEVLITVTTSIDQAHIAVHDNGDGIPEKFKSRIFSKFAQADSSDTRQKGGTGLGLSITKGIVEQHGGAIHFESGVNNGTTFYVDLALHEAIPEIALKSNDSDSDQSLFLVARDEPDISK
jgi:PAS domain S-box-containing protein